jgi:hypothetical protein
MLFNSTMQSMSSRRIGWYSPRNMDKDSTSFFNKGTYENAKTGKNQILGIES